MAVALGDHLQKAAARVKILLIDFEVFGQRNDAVGKQRNLYIGTARVMLVPTKVGNNLLTPLSLLPLPDFSYFHRETFSTPYPSPPDARRTARCSIPPL